MADDARSVSSRQSRKQRGGGGRPSSGGKSMVGGVSRRGVAVPDGDGSQHARAKGALQMYQEKQRELAKTLELSKKRLHEVRHELNTAQAEWAIQEKSMEKEVEMTTHELETDRLIAKGKKAEVRQAFEEIAALKKQFLECCTLTAQHFIPADRDGDQIELADIRAPEFGSANKGDEALSMGSDPIGSFVTAPSYRTKSPPATQPLQAYWNLKKFLQVARRDVSVMEHGRDTPTRDLPGNDNDYEPELLPTPITEDPDETPPDGAPADAAVAAPAPPAEDGGKPPANPRAQRALEMGAAVEAPACPAAADDKSDNESQEGSKRSFTASEVSGATDRSGASKSSHREKKEKKEDKRRGVASGGHKKQEKTNEKKADAKEGKDGGGSSRFRVAAHASLALMRGSGKGLSRGTSPNLRRGQAGKH